MPDYGAVGSVAVGLVSALKCSIKSAGSIRRSPPRLGLIIKEEFLQGGGIEERFALKRILYDSQREIKQVFGQTRKVTACSICSGVLIRLPLVIFVIIF
jgi:hypothetical protein